MEQKSEEDGEEFVPGCKTVQEFSAGGFKHVVNAVKAFQALPQPGPSWDLYKSYPEFSRSLKNARSKMIPMMASLMKHVNIPTSDFRSRDIDEKFEFLVDCNDDLLERIGSSLDEADGFKKKSEIVIVDKGAAHTSLKPPGTWGKRKLDALSEVIDEGKSKSEDISSRPIKKPNFRFRVTEKPQLKFLRPIDNSTAPFVPKLKDKPHSLKPLSILPEYTMKNEEFYGHPYAVELNKWEPSDAALTPSEPQSPKELKITPVIYVSNLRDLDRLKQDLLTKSEIAVDVEHHSFRTYLGLTCLIQISTRDKDYVIDTLALREELSPLNEVLANPKILKVFHGATSDIDWLQRDLGLYVVNMFDTHLAAKVLNLPKLSLQFLLGKYCDVAQNKSLQLADWRLRPLPNDMLEYARQDTHYLLYIYERLRNELITSGNQHCNLLLSVYDQSRLTCLKRYEKPVSNAQLALRKTRHSLNNRQLYAFTEIYKWRDEIARDKDESLGYVLPNHMLLTISESLPKEMNGILACCDPVPPLIHSNLGRIHKIITIARALPLRQETTQKNKEEKKVKLKNWMVVVNSLHDVTPVEPEEEDEDDDDMDLDDESTKTAVNTTIAASWPEPWADPGGWQKFVGSKGTSGPCFRFNRNLVQKRSAAQSTSSTFFKSEDVATPFGRYQITKKIHDMMKDPEKEKDINLKDPLVKAAVEALSLKDESELDTQTDPVEEDHVPVPAKVLEEGEFIPVNPLAGAESVTKNRKRQARQGTWSDEKPKVQIQQIDLDSDGEYVSDPEDNFAVPSTKSPLMNSGKAKSKRNKKGKAKLLNRIKNIFSNKKGDSNPTEVIDVEMIAEPKGKSGKWKVKQETDADSIAPPPPKRIKEERQHTPNRNPGKNQQGYSANRNSPKNERRNFSPNRGRGNRQQQQDHRQKNKTGIFKAWKRDNRSITFK